MEGAHSKKSKQIFRTRNGRRSDEEQDIFPEMEQTNCTKSRHKYVRIISKQMVGTLARLATYWCPPFRVVLAPPLSTSYIKKLKYNGYMLSIVLFSARVKNRCIS